VRCGVAWEASGAVPPRQAATRLACPGWLFFLWGGEALFLLGMHGVAVAVQQAERRVCAEVHTNCPGHE